MSKTQKIYVEASPLTEDRMSGIGHMLLETVRAIDELSYKKNTPQLILVVSFDKAKKLDRFKFKTARIKKIPVPLRIFNGLWKYDLLPHMDILLGRGMYIFSNYKNWRLIRSQNYTYISDVSYLLYPQYVSQKNQKFLEKNIHKWAKRADRVITISENSAKEIAKLIPVAKNKTTVIHCGVDKSKFYQKPTSEIQRVKNNIGVKGNYYIYIGNFEPRKNIEGLLDAYSKLPDSIRDKQKLLLIGGGGWLNEAIMSKIAVLQKRGMEIIKPEYYVKDEDLPAIISGATALVHPAHYEGFGIPPLQAMACETPIIIANNSSLPEVGGDAAIYVDANDSSAITTALIEVVENKAETAKRVKIGLRRTAQFNWDKAAEKLLEAVK